MEKRIVSLLAANNPGNGLTLRIKELDDKMKWLLHNNRNMDNYLELETFSKDGELCQCICDTLNALPEVPTIAEYKDYKEIIILLGLSTTYYQILDELAEQHRYRDDVPELLVYCGALHWMRRDGNACATCIIRYATPFTACACIQ